MAKPDYEALKARVLAQIPVKHVSAPRNDAPFSTYVKYGKRMLEYMAAGCEIDEAFLLTHEQYQAPKLARAKAIRLVEWRLENITDAEWSEPPRQFVGPWQAEKRERGRRTLAALGLPGGAIRADGQLLLIGDGEDHRW